MNLNEAIDSRMSCRAFLPTPVAEATVRAILDGARRAPSGGNVQPWHVHAITGPALQEFLARIRSQLPAHPRGEGSEYDIYPHDLWEPYHARRAKCAEDMYATIGVAREEKGKRLMHFARNFEFFGAPVALFFCIDRRLGPPQWSDLGMYMQTVMLLARSHGLHTCAQEAWSMWYRTVAEFLGLPAELMLFSGMALGYRDESHPINRLRTDRAPLEEFATFRGF
ncbi:MAG TPA: nitroreductase [Steroidobacteraceae bacterium]|nr:nitroreductase [Steroidobacteraceae bacterium]